MTVQAGLRTARYWARIQRTTRRDAVPADRARIASELALGRADAAEIADALARDGVAAVPGYWSPERCAGARAALERALALHPEALRVASGGSDRRLYGAEAVAPELAAFHADAWTRRMGELASGFGLYPFATLGARIDATPSNRGSGDGWHRDWHGSQFKSILYLCDVGDDNGPFEYVLGSQRARRAVLDTLFGGLPAAPATRYTPEQVERVVARSGATRRVFPGAAGTLLLVNSAGIHRGRPLASGARLALTNYYYPPSRVDEALLRHFSPLAPGAAERIRRELGLAREAEVESR